MVSNMTISDLRKELKAIGFKVKLTSMSFGKHAVYCNADGIEMPSIFFGESARQSWIKLIEYREVNRERLKELGKSNQIIGLPL